MHRIAETREMNVKLCLILLFSSRLNSPQLLKHLNTVSIIVHTNTKVIKENLIPSRANWLTNELKWAHLNFGMHPSYQHINYHLILFCGNVECPDVDTCDIVVE